VIADATPMRNATADTIAIFAANAGMLLSFGGLVNATGGVGTGHYLDWIGRANAYLVNVVVSASCPFLIQSISQPDSPRSWRALSSVS
jgi:OFA family oxalate/formate antiporter-like MFS transporter